MEKTEMPKLRVGSKAKLFVDFYPTEDVDRLSNAVKKIFPDARLTPKGRELVGEASTEYFVELLEKQKIRSTVYGRIESAREDGEVTIELSKMACEAGIVGLHEEFPLGAVKVRLSII